MQEEVSVYSASQQVSSKSTQDSEQNVKLARDVSEIQEEKKRPHTHTQSQAD